MPFLCSDLPTVGKSIPIPIQNIIDTSQEMLVLKFTLKNLIRFSISQWSWSASE